MRFGPMRRVMAVVNRLNEQLAQPPMANRNAAATRTKTRLPKLGNVCWTVGAPPAAERGGQNDDVEQRERLDRETS